MGLLAILKVIITMYVGYYCTLFLYNILIKLRQILTSRSVSSRLLITINKRHHGATVRQWEDKRKVRYGGNLNNFASSLYYVPHLLHNQVYCICQNLS